MISELEGFQAYYLIRTPEGSISVSVYDTEAGAEESVRAAAVYLCGDLPDFAVVAPQVASGEVVVTPDLPGAPESLAGRAHCESGGGLSAATAAVAMLRAALESSNLPFNLDDARLLVLVDGES